MRISDWSSDVCSSDLLTPEYIEASHLDWQIFPNSIYLHGAIDSVIWYRFRPNGHDPDSCIMDVWSLERYAEGKQPPLKREFYADWRETEAKGGRDRRRVETGQRVSVRVDLGGGGLIK